MNKVEYGKLIDLQLKDNPPIQAEDLFDISDRTLLYGYTCNSDTFHVYVKDKQIYTVLYRVDFQNDMPSLMRKISVSSNADYIPDKWLYPEACDFRFCEMLKKIGYELPFTTWNNERLVSKFYGFILEDKKCCGNCGVIEDSHCNNCEEYNGWIPKNTVIG